MNSPALARFAEFLNGKGLTSAVLSNPATICWLTGYAPPIQTGPNPFEGGPALGWLSGYDFTLVLSDSEAPAARALGIPVCEYGAYTIESPAAGYQKQAAALGTLLHDSSGLKGKVGIELNLLPASMLETIKEALPAVELLPLDGSFDDLRAIKSSAEIERIRRALALCDLAQIETRRLMKAGVAEVAMWGQVKARLELEAGGRLPMLADFVGGLRTAEIGGLPGKYALCEGDPVIADIVPRLEGYWGDNCGTHFVGQPSAEMEKIYRLVRAVLADGVAAVRPGVRACDLDRQMRSAIEKAGYPVYPHHSGHGLGVTYHEEPRIVPYNADTLQPGMVIALEPGIYVPDMGGVRLEDVVLVTRDGCEVLTRHLAGS